MSTPRTQYRSPLLDRHGAVAAADPDAGVALHYGDPFAEQRALAQRAGWVDRSTRGVIAVPGEDRAAWLHDLTSQHLSGLADGQASEALVLSPTGRVEHHVQLSDLGGTTWLDVEGGTAAELLAYLDSMRFWSKVDPRKASADWALVSLVGPATADVLGRLGVAPGPDVRALPGGGWVRTMRWPREGGADLLVPRETLTAVADRLTEAAAAPAGIWAYEALRVESRRPRLGMDTDHKTIPHEVGWIGVAVHLDKGCYRGQETVARVQNLGRPPRKLVLLHLDGSSESLPGHGEPVEVDGRAVGFIGTAVRHFELGPIALAVLKRSVAESTATLLVAGQNAVVDG